MKKAILFGVFACLLATARLGWTGARENIDNSVFPAQLAKIQQQYEERLAAMAQTYNARLEAIEDQFKARTDQLQSQINNLSQGAKPEYSPERNLETALDRWFEQTQPAPNAPAGPASQGFQSFNPDISLVGDFVFHANSRGGAQPDNAFSMRETEMAVSAYADPFTRADFFIALEKEIGEGEFETDLEEAFLTFLNLPEGFQARVGKMRARFGKANAVHRHALPWPDHPFVLANFFGEEGLLAEGVEISWLVPNPWDRYIELLVSGFNNNNEILFAGEDANSFTPLVRLRDSNPLSEASNLEIGLSAAAGANADRNALGETLVGGVDVTYKWRPPLEGRDTSFLWQTELIAVAKDRGDSDTADAWGAYSAVEYQCDRLWLTGVRWDFSQMPDEPGLHESGYSAFLTFLQSEFVRWRAGYTFRDRNYADEAGRGFEHEFMLQATFNIGPHGAHEF